MAKNAEAQEKFKAAMRDVYKWKDEVRKDPQQTSVVLAKLLEAITGFYKS